MKRFVLKIEEDKEREDVKIEEKKIVEDGIEGWKK